MPTNKKLKKLKQLKDVGKLYDCKVKCLLAVSFLVDNNLLEPEHINSLFDNSKTCSNMSIREFMCEIIPGLNNCCVCGNLEDKIKDMAIQLTSFGEIKEEPRK